MVYCFNFLHNLYFWSNALIFLVGWMHSRKMDKISDTLNRFANLVEKDIKGVHVS